MEVSSPDGVFAEDEMMLSLQDDDENNVSSSASSASEDIHSTTDQNLVLPTSPKGQAVFPRVNPGNFFT